MNKFIWVGQGLIGLGLLFYALYSGYDKFRDKFTWFCNKNKKILTTKHFFFDQMSFWIKHGASYIETSHYMKTLQFRKWLKIKLQVFYGAFYDLAKKIDNGEHVDLTLSALTEFFYDNIDKYNKICLDQGVISVVVEALDKWSKPRIEDTVNYLTRLASSNLFIDSHKIKFIRILDGMFSVFNDSFEDMERAAKEINGSIEKALYEQQYGK